MQKSQSGKKKNITPLKRKMPGEAEKRHESYFLCLAA